MNIMHSTILFPVLRDDSKSMIRTRRIRVPSKQFLLNLSDSALPHTNARELVSSGQILHMQISVRDE